MVRDTTAEDFCKTISNFSLEYRTTRQAILLQRERERQKIGAESPGPNTPSARRKRQQTPTQVFVSDALKVKCHSGINGRLVLLTRCLLMHQENEEQLRLEEVLRTPESTSRLDVTLPRNRRRMADIQGTLCDMQQILLPLTSFICQMCYTEPIFVYSSGPFSRKMKL